MAHEFALTDLQLGWLVTGHALSLTISKLVLGSASDRILSRTILLQPLLALCGASVALAFATKKEELAVVVLLSAGLQGSAWPTAVTYLQKWYSADGLGLRMSILSASSTIGGLFIAFAASFYWRTFTFNLGVATFIVYLVAYFFIDGGETTTSDQATSKTTDQNIEGLKKSVSSIVRSRAVWHLGVLYALAMQVRTISEIWLPQLVADFDVRNTMQLSFEAGGFVGSILSGVMADKLAMYFGRGEKTTRFLLLVLTAAMLVMTSLLTFSLSYSPAAISILSMLSGSLVYSCINIACLATALMPENQGITGTLTAFISFISQFGSVTAGTPVALLLAHFGSTALSTFLLSQLAICTIIAFSDVPFILLAGKPVNKAN